MSATDQNLPAISAADTDHPRPGLLAWFVARLSNRPDSEHEQCLVRLVLGVFILGYVCVLGNQFGFENPQISYPLAIAVIGQSIALFLFLAVVIWPGISLFRRHFAIFLDTGSLSFFLLTGGELAAPLYPIYLWVTLGYGFRYGPRYLLVTGLASLVGFLIVITQTPFWLKMAPHLAIGLLLGLILIPAYALSLLNKLTRAKALAEEASQAKSRFLANMSHELRTPLTTVIGISDLLRESLRENDQREMVATIKTAARALLHLINEVLEFSKVEAGKLTIQSEDFNLCQMLADVTSIVEPQATAKGLVVSYHIEQGVPLHLKGDVNHLRQILINLLGNAIKFTERGHALVAVKSIARHENKVDLCFEVVDTGIGIRQKMHGRIFESFTQADESIGRQYGGAGLGLSIVRQIIEILGGRIELESEVGLGATFRIYLALEVQGTSNAVSPRMFDDALVSIVSDDDSFGPRAAEALRGAGAQVRLVPNIPQLIRIMGERAGQQAANAVLIDARCVSSALSLVADGLFNQFGRRCMRLILVSDYDVPGERYNFVARLRTGALRGDVLRAVEAALAATTEQTEKAEKAESGAQLTVQSASRQLSILLVEDNFTNGAVLEKLLNRAGHRVSLVDSADSALDRLDVETFDLVITDLNLPGTSGLDLVKLYRMAHLEEKTPLPFIAVTADVTEESRRRCLEAGMAGVVPKPVDMLQMLTLIGTLFPDSHDRPSPTESVASERLVAISAHPRFNQSVEPVLDTAVLRELHALGGSGSGFFRDLVSDFMAEADDLLRKMGEAAKTGDLTAFRAHSHALRGSLADIGARRMYRLCLDFRSPSAERLEREGDARIAELKDEFLKLRHMLSVEAARLDPTIAEKTLG